MSIGCAVKERILQLCRERKITVNKLSVICRITQSTLNNIVNERNQTVTITTIKKIWGSLEINVVDFFACDLFLNLEQEIEQRYPTYV